MLWCGKSVSTAQNALELNIYDPGDIRLGSGTQESTPHE